MLILLTEAISRQANVDCVECLRVMTLRPVYGGKEPSGAERNTQCTAERGKGQWPDDATGEAGAGRRLQQRSAPSQRPAMH